MKSFKFKTYRLFQIEMIADKIKLMGMKTHGCVSPGGGGVRDLPGRSMFLQETEAWVPLGLRNSPQEIHAREAQDARF